MTTLIAPPGNAALLDNAVEPRGVPITSTVPASKSMPASTALTIPAPARKPVSTPVGKPVVVEDDEDWRDLAVCKDDPEPDRWVDLPQVVIKGRLNPDYDERLNELAAVCNTCPVAAICLGESLGLNVRGVFAGHDEFDRADMRESLGLPTPPMVPAPETDDDARLIEQQFTAQRLARRGMSNKQIAAELGVSTMTVSRLFASDDKPAKRRARSTS